MIMDEKGKLFGKVSIVDILIVVVVVLALAVIGVKSTKPLIQGKAGSEVVCDYTITVRGIRDLSVNAVKEGAMVFDSKDNPIGEVVGKSVQPARGLIKKTDGTFVYAEKPDKYDMELKIKGDGVLNDAGVFLGGKYQITLGTEGLFKTQTVDYSGAVTEFSYTEK